MMYKALVNEKFSFEFETEGNQLSLDGESVAVDVSSIGAKAFHVLHNNQSYLADIVEFNREEKYCVIKLSGTKYKVAVKDQYDELLQQLGLDKAIGNRVNDVKAPMPGLVLNVLVTEGDAVKKGDNLFILEAMKMENIIKAQADAVIKTVKVKPGDKVEKNQPVILFA